MVANGGNNGGNGLLNSQIHNLIAIIGQNNIDQIFANIMHITLDCSKDNFTFTAGIISGLHKVF